MNAKEKSLKKMRSTPPVNMCMIRKRNSLIAEMEKVCLDRRLNQPQHSLKPKPNPEQGTKSIHFMKSETEARKLQRKRGGFMRLRERSYLITLKCRMKQQGLT